MVKAIWNKKIIAESNETKVIEGNHYFPKTSVKKEFLKPSNHKSVCPWKGDASYYNLEVDGKTNENAAWYYPNPKKEAEEIKDHVAFWNGVEIIE